MHSTWLHPSAPPTSCRCRLRPREAQIAPHSAFTSRQARTSVPPVYPDPRRSCSEAREGRPAALLIFLLPPGNPFRNGSVRARLESCRNRRETTADLAAEAVCPFFANAPSTQIPHSFRAKPALPYRRFTLSLEGRPAGSFDVSLVSPAVSGPTPSSVS